MKEILGDPFSIQTLCLDEVQVEADLLESELEGGLEKAVPMANAVALNFMANKLLVGILLLWLFLPQ